MQTIARRKLMQGGAALAVAAAVPIAVKADQAEDAELLSLWEQFKVQLKRYVEAGDALSDIDEKVNEASGPWWELAKINVYEGRAVFISSRHDDDSTKVVPIKPGKSYAEAEHAAKEAGYDLHEERAKRRTAAEKRYGHSAAEKAWEIESDRLHKIELKIAKTPAMGLHGMAVKLALWKYNSDARDTYPDDVAIETAYKTLVKLTGVDLAAQVEGQS